MTIARGACLLLPALLGACWEVTRPPLSTLEGLPTEPPAPVSKVVPVEEDLDVQPEVAPVATTLRGVPSLQITEVVGLTPAAAGAMLAPAVEALERCQTESTGKLVLRLIAEPGRTHVRVVEASGIDGATNRCALSAVGTFEVDEAVQQSWSPIDAVHRVETQLVLSW